MKKRMTLMLAGLATLMLVLSACQQRGINSDDAALIRQQLEDVASRLDVVEDRIQDLATEDTGSEMLISQVRNELNQARTTLAEVDDKLAPAADELTDDGLGTDGLNDPLQEFGDDVQDTFDGATDSLNEFGNDLQQGIDEFGNDVNERIDDLQQDLDTPLTDPLNDPLNDGPSTPLNGAPEPEPAQPGSGGGASDTVPGIPAAPGQ